MLFWVKSFLSNSNQKYWNEIEKICVILLNLFFHVSKLALRFKIHFFGNAPHKKCKIWKFIKYFHISRLYFIHHLMIRDRNVQWVDNHSLKSLQQKLTEIYLSELGSQTFAYMLKWISRFCLQHHFSMLSSLHL